MFVSFFMSLYLTKMKQICNKVDKNINKNTKYSERYLDKTNKNRNFQKNGMSIVTKILKNY